MKRLSAIALLLTLGMGLGGCAGLHGVKPSAFYSSVIQSRS